MVELRLERAQFWDAPQRDELALLERAADDGFLGLRIAAPDEVDLDARATLPLVTLRSASLRDAARSAFRKDAVGVALRLESGEAWAGGFAREKGGRPPPRRPAADLDEDPGEGLTANLYVHDLRERLGLPWRPGTLRVTLFQGEHASNPVTVRLVRAGGALARDPDVAQFLAARRRPAYPQPVWPPIDHPYPSYERDEETSPPVPDARGFAVTLDRVVELEPRRAARCMLRASFRLPLLPRHVVRPAPEDDEAAPSAPREAPTPDETWEQAEAREAREATRLADARARGLVWQDVGDAGATAVLPVVLVACPLPAGRPQVWPLQVPVDAPLDPAAPPAEVAGHLHLDLLALPEGRRLRGGSWAVWLLAGEHASGPHRTAVVPSSAVGGGA